MSPAVPGGLGGVAYMLISAACFAGSHTLIRYVSADVHPFEIAFFRNLFGFLLLTPWFVRTRFRPMRTRRLGLYTVRGAFNAGFMLCYFMGLSMIPVALATALNFTAPLFTVLLSVLILREMVGPHRWGALLVGFAGTLIITRPGFAEVSPGALLVLLACLFSAANMIAVKMLSRTEPSVAVAAYATAFIAPITLVAAIPFWTWPSPRELLLMVAIAAVATTAQTALAASFKRADASAVIPVSYTRLVWAALFGFVALGELPDLWVWVGSAVILAGVTYIARRNARLGRPATKPVP